jgi:uncharacterized protein (TIGR04255 family)
MERLFDRPEKNFGDGAPIKEALIDIRVELPTETGIEELRRFHDGLEERFPTTITQNAFAQHIHMGGEGSTITTTQQHGVRGFLHQSADEDRVVQARRDGFTFSKLWPYKDWPALRDEAAELWPKYVDAAQPERVTRLAVRYLNRIVLPEGPVDLADWFRTRPEFSHMETPVSEFLVRVVIEHPSGEARAVVQLAALPKEDGETGTPILLDIDASCACEHDPIDPEIWKKLDDLRGFKNAIFFGSITDKTEELFQ